MTRLNTSRYVRTLIEQNAAAIIQAAYRGHSARQHAEDLRYSSVMSSDVRARVRAVLMRDPLLLAARVKVVLSQAEHRAAYAALRYANAVSIQCAFRCFVSRRCLRLRLYEHLFHMRRRAAVRIQCMSRKTSAVQSVRLVRQRASINRRLIAAIKMQAALRRLFARRRVVRRRIKLHYFAARIIQNAYRSQYSKKLIMSVKAAMKLKRQTRGIVSMQRLVRKLVAVRRVNRIRFRRLHLRLYGCVARIQNVIRCFTARRRAARLRNARADAALRTREQAREEERAARASSAAALAEKADVFLQARLGDINAVVEAHVKTKAASALDFSGNSVLLVAAAHGHLAIVQKCVQWGLDPIARNRGGDSALMLAVRGGHADVVRYLLELAQQRSSALPEGEEQQGAPPAAVRHLLGDLSEEDRAVMLFDAAALSTQPVAVQLLQLLLAERGAAFDVDLRASARNGCSAFHAAAAAGLVDTARFLQKSRCSVDQPDADGATPLLKASASSPPLLKLLLGVSEGFGIYMDEEERCSLLLRAGPLGRDCLLGAALAGQTQSVVFISERLGAAGRVRGGAPVQWDEAAVEQTFLLVESANEVCLEVVLAAGLALGCRRRDSGATLLHVAAGAGVVSVLDSLLARCRAASVSEAAMAVDGQGRGILHYAAACRRAQVVPHLLTSSDAIALGVGETMLAGQDSGGDTPLHVAAREGVALSIDLLARRGLEAALKCINARGLSPLMVACSRHFDAAIKSFLALGASAAGVDAQGRSCLWHLYHPHDSVSLSGKHKVVIGADAQKKSKSASADGVKRDKEPHSDDSRRLNTEIDLLKTLLRAGCPLYSRRDATVEELLSMKAPALSSASSCYCYGDDLDAGDIMVIARSNTLIGKLQEVLSAPDLWRLALSCLRFDSSKKARALASLFEGGSVARRLTDPAPAAGKAEPTPMFSGLEHKWHRGMSIGAWCIHLQRLSALQLLLRKGYSLSGLADSAGNTHLHLAAAYGSAAMVETVLHNNAQAAASHNSATLDLVRLEQPNGRGYTAVMEASAAGNQKTLLALCRCKADGRRGLEVRYWAFLLAQVRRSERSERNCQWGRFGEDDVMYFPLTDDPLHTVHYDPRSSFHSHV